jgi:hypothetical protein
MQGKTERENYVVHVADVANQFTMMSIPFNHVPAYISISRSNIISTPAAA